MFDRAMARLGWRSSVAAGLALAVVAWNDSYYLIYSAVFIALSLATRWLRIGVSAGRRPGNRVSPLLATMLLLDVCLMAAIWWSRGFSLQIGRFSVAMLTTFNLREAFWALLIAWALSRWWIVLKLKRREPGSPQKAEARALLVVMAAFVVAASPLIAEAVRLWASGDYASQAYLWRSGPAGIDAASVLLGNPLHLIYGSLTRSAYAVLGFDPVEGIGWPGGVLVVMLLGGWPLLRGHSEPRRWWVAVGVFGMWALGPFLTVLGWNTGLVLPAMLLRFVPIVANARMPGRAMVMVALAAAMLLAHALAARAGTRSAGWRLLLIAVLLLDCATVPLPLYRIEPDRIDAYLASRPEAGAVLGLPLGLRDGFGETGRFDHRALFDQTVTGLPMLGGFVARLPTRVKGWYEETPIISSLLKLSDPACPPGWVPPDYPAAQAHEVLAGLHVRYVVVNRALSPARLVDYVFRTLPLRPVTTDGDRELYEVRGPADPREE
jgi:hypothetical protein